MKKVFALILAVTMLMMPMTANAKWADEPETFKVEFNTEVYYLDRGETPKIDPVIPYIEDVLVYRSSRRSVAVVRDGYIIPRHPGRAYIYALINGHMVGKITVWVMSPVYDADGNYYGYGRYYVTDNYDYGYDNDYWRY